MTEIWTASSDGSDRRNVSRLPCRTTTSQIVLGKPNSNEYGPTWSPDGTWIAMEGSGTASWCAGLCLIRPDGSERKDVRDASNTQLFPIYAWRPVGVRGRPAG